MHRSCHLQLCNIKSIVFNIVKDIYRYINRLSMYVTNLQLTGRCSSLRILLRNHANCRIVDLAVLVQKYYATNHLAKRAKCHANVQKYRLNRRRLHYYLTYKALVECTHKIGKKMYKFTVKQYNGYC